MTLAPDDLRPGLFVTLSEGPAAHAITCAGIEQIEDRQLNGVVLKVLAINLPFVAVEVQMNKARTPLDVRAVEFCRLNNDYVRALHPEITPPVPAPAAVETFAQEEIQP